MLRITHSQSISEYDKFLVKFHKKVKTWLNETGDQDIRSMFKELETLDGLRRWAYQDAESIKKRIQDIEIQKNNKKINDTKFKELTYELFVENGYKKFSPKLKAALIEDSGLSTCAYCNNSSIRIVKYKRKDDRLSYVKGELDHFYPESIDRYPYLAICLYNLVPCCKDCNGRSGKKDDDPLEKKKELISPYEIKSSDDITFRVDVKKGNFYSLDKIAQSLSVEYDIQDEVDSRDKERLKNNIKTFHIKELYEANADYVAELYYKRQKLAPAYLKWRDKIMSEEHLSMSERTRLLLGIYTDEKDYGKRPLSKFCADIARQFGLI